jgi:DNA-binding response OmpR family regulator
MIIIVDNRQLVRAGYHSLFEREGVASAGFGSSEFAEWMAGAADEDMISIRAFLIGDCGQDNVLPRRIRDRTGAPVIALCEQHCLENTLRLFNSGVDDVVRKPVHIRELLARILAIRARHKASSNHIDVGAMRVFLDGRDPEIAGQALALPRRERRILEYLASNAARRVSRTQVFNATYGIFDEEVEESVVETHISKLRKKIRDRLGYDAIDSKRFLGYQLIADPAARCPVGDDLRDQAPSAHSPGGRDVRPIRVVLPDPERMGSHGSASRAVIGARRQSFPVTDLGEGGLHRSATG